MRIGIVLSNTPTYSETFFRNKIAGLTEAGHTVTVFTQQQNSNFDLCECEIGFASGFGFFKDLSTLSVALIRMLLSPIKTFRLFSQNRKDQFSLHENIRSLLICAHLLNAKLDWLHFGFATLALGRENLASIIGTKMLVSIRGYDMMVYPKKNPGCYHLLWKRIDKLHYISDALLSHAIKQGFDHLHAPSQKITPAINTEDFTVTTKPVNKKLKIATTARLHWIKGLEYTLEALFLLKQSGVDFEYSVIGDGEEKERLVFAAHQLGIAGNVKFLGKLPPKKIIPILAETDIYIQYSISEGFCNSVLEAQAMGCLCIVSNAEGLTENVLHNQTGFVTIKRSPDHLFRTMQHVLSMNEQEKVNITTEARKRVKQDFNLHQQQMAFITLYAK